MLGASDGSTRLQGDDCRIGVRWLSSNSAERTGIYALVDMRFDDGCGLDIRLKAIAQKASVALVDPDEAIDRRNGIGKGFGCDALRSHRAQCGLHVIDQIPPDRHLTKILSPV
jgi:hypothetical protein